MEQNWKLVEASIPAVVTGLDGTLRQDLWYKFPSLNSRLRDWATVPLVETLYTAPKGSCTQSLKGYVISNIMVALM